MCVGPTHDLTLDVGCRILRMPTATVNDHKPRLVRVVTFMSEGLYACQMHCDCSCNQLRSLVGRIAGRTPKPTPEGMEELRRAALEIKHHATPTAADNPADMPKRYSGMKRQRYERAVQDLLSAGLAEKDFWVKMFIKKEKFDPLSKVNPDPRAIQYRGAKFCVALAQFLHPIEMKIYQIAFMGKGVPHSRNIVKGLNSAARATLLVEKMSHFMDPVLIGLDASRWDKHVSREFLRLEHQVYLWFNPDPYFAWLLSKQLINVGVSNKGLKYVVQGRRMSGDMNTAVGNCVLMLIVLYAFLVSCALQKWDIIDDGDDSVVIIERRDLDKVVAAVPDMVRFGLTMKIESVADNIHQIEFCQSKVIEYAPQRYKFVRSWTRVVSRSMSGCRHWEDPKYRARTLRAIGACELALNLGVPVLQSFAVMLMRNCPEEGIRLENVHSNLLHTAKKELRALGMSIDDIKPQPITIEARLSFSQAFGVSPSEQIRLEQRFDGTTLNQSNMRVVNELDVQGWVLELEHANIVAL